MFKARGPPLGVALDRRRVCDPHLVGHIVDHRDRHVSRVRQERARCPHRRQLQPEPQTRMRATSLADQLQIGVDDFPTAQARVRDAPDVPGD